MSTRIDAPSPSPKVALAISAFRSDAAVASLLAGLGRGDAYPFSHVLVVDSLGSGSLRDPPASIRTPYFYENAAQNLGSAGNLARRLALAAEVGADYVYAVNHDGTVDAGVIRALVEVALEHPRLGAAYPLRFYEQRGTYNMTGRYATPGPARGVMEPPTEPTLEVSWASSNGALYALEPVRRGLTPWADLWMGWEDLGYGWVLQRSGYAQLVVTRALVVDNYEYRRVRILGRELTITDKPSWYTYYQIRNLILCTRRAERPVRDHAMVCARVLAELALTATFRDDKVARVRGLAEGLVDGLRGRPGKWRRP